MQLMTLALLSVASMTVSASVVCVLTPAGDDGRANAFATAESLDAYLGRADEQAERRARSEPVAFFEPAGLPTAIPTVAATAQPFVAAFSGDDVQANAPAVAERSQSAPPSTRNPPRHQVKAPVPFSQLPRQAQAPVRPLQRAQPATTAMRVDPPPPPPRRVAPMSTAPQMREAPAPTFAAPASTSSFSSRPMSTVR